MPANCKEAAPRERRKTRSGSSSSSLEPENSETYTFTGFLNEIRGGEKVSARVRDRVNECERDKEVENEIAPNQGRSRRRTGCECNSTNCKGTCKTKIKNTHREEKKPKNERRGGDSESGSGRDSESENGNDRRRERDLRQPR